MDKFRFAVYSCLVGIAASFAGCASPVCKSPRSFLLEDSIGLLENNTLSAVTEPEVINFYKQYFPNGKFELSSGSCDNKTPRFFVRPSRVNSSYEILFGIEKKF
jgi:hypothetical protein